jgi:hypothetical protein
MRVQTTLIPGATVNMSQPVLCGRDYQHQHPWCSIMYLPFSIVIRSIIDHGKIDDNRHEQSDEVDHQAGENHESRTADASPPCLMSSAGFPVANVDHGECWVMRLKMSA